MTSGEKARSRRRRFGARRFQEQFDDDSDWRGLVPDRRDRHDRRTLRNRVAKRRTEGFATRFASAFVAIAAAAMSVGPITISHRRGGCAAVACRKRRADRDSRDQGKHEQPGYDPCDHECRSIDLLFGTATAMVTALGQKNGSPRFTPPWQAPPAGRTGSPLRSVSRRRGAS